MSMRNKILRPNGYVLVAPNHIGGGTSNGYILEHRFVMQNHINRKLKKGEVVHHINSDKQDNRIENLKLYASNKDHWNECHRRNPKTIFCKCGCGCPIEFNTRRKYIDDHFRWADPSKTRHPYSGIKTTRQNRQQIIKSIKSGRVNKILLKKYPNGPIFI